MDNQAPQNFSEQRVVNMLIEAANMSRQSVFGLERTLKKEPDNLDARIKLLSYYFWKSDSENTADAQLEHLIWFLKQAPDNPILRNGPGNFPRGNEKVAELWKGLIQNHSDNVDVLENAAEYFKMKDNRLCEALYLKAQSLDPENSHWPESLWLLHTMTGSYEQACTQMQIAMNMEKFPMKRWYMMTYYCDTAFAANMTNESRESAKRVLDSAKEFKWHWNYGNAIFWGNHTLGRVALKEGSVDSAKDFLMRAGRTPGSFLLAQEGPSFALAQDLLDRGEKEVVMRFLKECQRFWPAESVSLKQKIEKIKSGQTVSLKDFGKDSNDTTKKRG